METYMVLRWLLHSVSNRFSVSSSSKVDDMISSSSKDDNHDQYYYYYYSNGGSYTNDHHLAAEKTTKQVEEQGKCGMTNYYAGGFQMPLHYPRYKKADYEKMEEWKVEMLLQEYGLTFKGTLEEKRSFAIGAFLWPDQL
ncbi:hypothetical protein BVC80_1663g44 [Macleaya cordata]|uniref:DUF7722 domain-containing protein n=1 Tax=Macleaya cordata TaxID=56857 RepID=A0A200RBQ3_MACCD|nr:hypothetical protein BVC80_1663g44 [Macleaya cordata]